jgi:hypothetical protein
MRIECSDNISALCSTLVIEELAASKLWHMVELSPGLIRTMLCCNGQLFGSLPARNVLRARWRLRPLH